MTSAWRRPAAAIRRCAFATDGAAMSAPVTWPEGPTRAASSSTVVPLPQPMSSTCSPGCGAAVMAPGRERVPAVSLHEFGPAAVEVTQIVLARFGLGDIHHRTGDAQPLRLVILNLETEPLLVAVGVAPRDRAATRCVRVVPVLHVVLLGHPSRAGITDVVVAQEILDLRRCRLVDQVPAPHLRLVGAA